MNAPSLRFTLRALIAAAALLGTGGAQAAANYYTPGGDDDPRVRSAKFLGEDKRHLSALVDLLRIQAEGAKAAAPQYPWLLADNYLSFGLHDRASAIYDGFGPVPVDPLQYNRARLKQAQFEYTRGYLPEARSTLLQLRENLPKEVLVDWQDLLSKVLLTQGRNQDALDILLEPKNGDDQSQYTRYNLGIALLREGRTEQGRTVLERVGKLNPSDRDSLALMDKANLTLGWEFLRAKQGASAIPVLRRVRVEGPFSNRALLGLGWASLSPDSKGQRREDVDDGSGLKDAFGSFSTLGVLLRRGMVDENHARNRIFSRQAGSENLEAALGDALPAWLLLIDRDPQDPAVQEGWLAIPYALDQLGAHEQARGFYEQAIEKLEAARERTARAIDSLRGNRMIDTIVKRDIDAESGWNWELKDLPDAPETYYLQTLIAEHRFAEALKNYRDMRLLARNLDSWEKRLADVNTAYARPDRASLAPSLLFAKAMQNHTEMRSSVQIKLATELNLSAPGRYKQEAPEPPSSSPRLELSSVPTQFAGTFEQIEGLKKRLASLKPAVQKMGDEQAKLLQKIGSDELGAQKTLIEKYLVEARFALARLYDRQVNTTDPDEYEIKK